MELNSSENSANNLNSTEIVSVSSQISPWLTPFIYVLACDIVLPFYLGKIQVNGQENIPTSGPVMLAPTHRSRWDPLILGYATGRRVTGRDLRFMVTHTEMMGVQGWFIRHLGGFPVDLRRPAIATLRHSIELLLEEQMLVIFPEGGIFQDGEVHSLKQGMARLAISAESTHPNLGIKIVPINITYGEIIPTKGCGVTVNIGEPIVVANYCSQSPKQSGQLLTTALENAIKQLAEDSHNK